jgi:hypothetical protein
LCERERIRKSEDNSCGGKRDCGEFHGRSLRKKDNPGEEQRFRCRQIIKASGPQAATGSADQTRTSHQLISMQTDLKRSRCDPGVDERHVSNTAAPRTRNFGIVPGLFRPMN